MNFLMAIKHATIGYGIRRTGWHEDAILTLDNNGELWWVEQPPERPNRNGPAELCGGDPAYDLIEDDITAKDWETV